MVLVLVHELGHAAAVKLAGADLRSIDVDGAGGMCTWAGDVGSYWRAIIAWAGVLAQLVLYIGARAWLSLAEPELDRFAGEFVSAFLDINLIMAAFNLIPLRGFDGVEAWKLFPLCGARGEDAAPRGSPRSSARRGSAPSAR